MSFNEDAARSRRQMEVLIRHLDHPVPINLHSPDWRTVNSLIRSGLLVARGHSARPMHTVLTDKGREALCKLLGQMADFLVAALGYSPSLADQEPLAAALAKLAVDQHAH